MISYRISTLRCVNSSLQFSPQRCAPQASSYTQNVARIFFDTLLHLLQGTISECQGSIGQVLETSDLETYLSNAVIRTFECLGQCFVEEAVGIFAM